MSIQRFGDDAVIDLFEQYGKQRAVDKGEHLFMQGESNGNIFNVNSGLLKAYYLTRTGKEFVKSFIQAGSYIGSINAMLEVGACSFNVVALEPSIVTWVAGDAVLDLGEKNILDLHQVNTFLLHVIQKKEKREYDFLCLSAEERYAEFCREYPGLEARVNQYEIAGYLGITPVALSRIRSRL